jgi:hypothetical protein
MIMFPGFLSDRAKELADSFDYVLGFLSDRSKELESNYD